MAALLISFGHGFLECLLTEYMIKRNWLRAKLKGCLFTISSKKISAKDGEKLCASSQYTWLPREKTMPIGLPGRLQSLKEHRPILVSPAVDRQLKIYSV
jgi:hypothetical protein